MEVIFFLVAFVSEIVGTVAGFGSSTVFLPLALLFFDFKTTLVLVAIFHIFGNLGRISFFKSGLDKSTLIIFGIPSVVLTIAGASLVSYTPQELLKVILGIFLIVDITRIPIYFAEGFLSSKFYWYIPILFIIALAGSFTGKQILKRIPQKTFRKVVLVAILSLGIKFMV